MFGVIAENKKPGEVDRIQLGSMTKCFYPSDPSIILGSFSIICLAISSCFGVKSIFFSYNGKTIPTHALWRSTTLVAFFILSILLSILATSFLMWATITEGVHRHRNVHTDPVGKCPTAKTGLFGGAGFLALDAGLFWLICQMLTMNAREDYEDDEDTKGDYGKVSDVDYVSTADIPVNSKV
ncbi:hypothetical protein SUGI_0193390 [Cryptomeria japonica]|nr:hypothetical protein SUGI_0193390 [Cryptomeria japonica]